MKILKWTGLALLIIILLANLYVLVTGKTYVYRALIYNYVDIDDEGLFKSREIMPSSLPDPWPLSVHYNNFSLAEYTRERLDSLESVAFLIVSRDSLLFEEYWEGYGIGSRSNSFSMAKTFVGTLVGIAQKEGKLSIDDPVGKYVPKFAEGENKKLTVRHLLTMTSGLNWDESYSSPLSMTTEAYYGTDLPRLINSMKVINTPGETYDYLSGNTQLLAMILEKATGQKLSKYMEEKLWQPMGAEHKATWSLDREDGIEKAYCCIYADARDFARLGKLYLLNGEWNGKQVLNPEFVREATSPHNIPDLSGDPVDYYGYQWWLVPEYAGEKGIFYARGILGQYIIVLPERQLVVVRLGHLRAGKQGEHPAEIFTFISEGLRQDSLARSN